MASFVAFRMGDLWYNTKKFSDNGEFRCVRRDAITQEDINKRAYVPVAGLFYTGALSKAFNLPDESLGPEGEMKMEPGQKEPSEGFIPQKIEFPDDKTAIITGISFKGFNFVPTKHTFVVGEESTLGYVLDEGTGEPIPFVVKDMIQNNLKELQEDWPAKMKEESGGVVQRLAENEEFGAETGQMCEVCFGNDDLPYDSDHFTECRRCGKSVCMDCDGEMQSHPDWFKVCGECSDILDNVHDYGAETSSKKGAECFYCGDFVFGLEETETCCDCFTAEEEAFLMGDESHV